MENFVAEDDEQFNVIKKVIDLCDYYVLILGRRYGSVNERTGFSYTEMEYDYAIEKQIPVLVFALEDDADFPPSDEDDIKKGKLAEFKGRAMANRLASVWKDQADLLGKVAISIMKAKSEIKRPGWHRGSDGEQDLLLQIKTLQEENNLLRAGKEKYGIDPREERLQDSFYGVKITLHFTEVVFIITSNSRIERKMVETTLDELFKHISVRLMGVNEMKDFISAVSSFQSGYAVNTQEAYVVKNKFEQLELIETYLDENKNEIIELSDFGREIMNKLNA